MIRPVVTDTILYLKRRLATVDDAIAAVLALQLTDPVKKKRGRPLKVHPAEQRERAMRA